jgi:hypothetical protein
MVVVRLCVRTLTGADTLQATLSPGQAFWAQEGNVAPTGTGGRQNVARLYRPDNGNSLCSSSFFSAEAILRSEQPRQHAASPSTPSLRAAVLAHRLLWRSRLHGSVTAHA